jgi:hypothetical protein
MGYGVCWQVDPHRLAAGAERLAQVAGTVDDVAVRLGSVCAGTAASAGGAELAAALEAAGCTASAALGRGAALVARLGAATAASSTDYLVLEQALTRRWTEPAAAEDLA